MPFAFLAFLSTLLLRPKAWNKISRGGRDVAGMSWAREIFAELRREEAQRELEEDGWYSCEEWSDVFTQR